MSEHLVKVRESAKRLLQLPEGEAPKSREELLALYKRFLNVEKHRIRLQHHAGASGLEVARQRADLLDVVLENLFNQAMAMSQGP
ncbi:MAG: hypothetical protein ACKVHP_03990, partial [Verrucomicrobiales bacterium]